MATTAFLLATGAAVGVAVVLRRLLPSDGFAAPPPRGQAK